MVRSSFFFNVYLFIFWLCQVVVAACRIFRCGAQGIVAVHGLLSSCSVRTPEHVDYVVAAHGLSSCGARAYLAPGLSCPAACGILVP